MKRKFIGFVLLIGTIISSCKKDSISATNSLQTIVNTDTTTTIFRAAISRANDSSMLLGTNAFAVVVPMDSAFIAAGMTLNVINSMPVSTLDSMIKYFFIPGYVQPQNGNSSILASGLGLPVYCYSDATYTYFNGNAGVLQPTSNANAKMYKIKNLILPPVYTLSQYLATDTSLALFNEAINHSGVINTLNNGWHTVFAPTDSAFINAGYPDITTIDNTNNAALTNLVNYNIANAPYFTYNLFGSVLADNGEDILVTYSNNILRLAGHSNNTLINLTKQNVVLAGNVILYKTDGVLLP